MKKILMLQLYATGIFLLVPLGFYVIRVIIPLLIMGGFLLLVLRVIFWTYKMILES